MLTIKDMNNRINYLKKIIPMYQDEMAGLEMLQSVYSNPEYAALISLEHEDAKQKDHSPKPVNQDRLHWVQTTLDKRPELFNQFSALIDANPNNMKVSKTPEFAKLCGVSTTTLSKFMDSLVKLDWLMPLGSSYYKANVDKMNGMKRS